MLILHQRRKLIQFFLILKSRKDELKFKFLNMNSSKNKKHCQQNIFQRTRKKNLKSVWNYQKNSNNQSNLEQIEQAGGIVLSNFKTYYNAVVIKKHGRPKKRQRSMEQSRGPRSKPTCVPPTNFQQKTKNTQSGKDQLFSYPCFFQNLIPSYF